MFVAFATSGMPCPLPSRAARNRSPTVAIHAWYPEAAPPCNPSHALGEIPLASQGSLASAGTVVRRERHVTAVVARRIACALMALIWSALHMAAVLHVHPGAHHGPASMGPAHARHDAHAHGHPAPSAAHAHACTHAHPAPSSEDPGAPGAEEDEASCGLCQVLHHVATHLFAVSHAVLYTAPAIAAVHPLDDPAATALSGWLPPGRAPPCSHA